ncbi:outer membrane protein assembly factor BamB family protein [Natronococcus wangiae]|uniref:outer membrane protein assembly factor BamB family protein n=1 Tax=Natronococcus wangiae TaxID=3068275 RepID=UPI00273FEB7D|nr:PQQ-binding-like beta-propeller repeat protein [Natronococcus sp. AD5]
MSTWKRRSVLTACAALSTTGALASIGSTTADETTPDSFAAGHPDGWSSSLGNPANSRYLPLEDGFPEPDSAAWRYDETGAVAVVDGRVYVHTESELRALDAEGGELEWDVEVPSADGRPAVSEDGIYVGDENHVTALDTADGSTRWAQKFDTDAPVPEPTVAFETVYVVADGTLHALDAADGSTRWTLDTVYARPADDETGDPMPASFRPETVAVANGTVYAALEGGTYSDGSTLEWAFSAIDATTGEDRWSVAVNATQSSPVTGPIIATGHAVYANHPGEGGLEFDLETGEVRELDRIVWTGTNDARLEVDHSGSEIVAYDRGTGENWGAETELDAWHGFVVAGETIIARHDPHEREEAAYPYNSVVGLSLEDGSVEWTLEFDDELPAIAAVDENTLYLEADGELVAFRPSEDEPDEGGEGSDDADDTDSDGDDGNEYEPGEDESTDDDTEGADDDTESDGRDDTGESADDATEPDEDDSVPGFTTGAGLLGGAATLEWLRRRAGTPEPAESAGSLGTDEPAE